MCKGHVLIVDAHARFLEPMQDILEIENYSLIVYSGPQCLKDLDKSEQPEIILVDYCLNKYSDARLCAQLQNHPETAGLPVILLSAYPEIYIPLRDIPHTVFIPKPFDLWELLACLEELLNSRRNQLA